MYNDILVFIYEHSLFACVLFQWRKPIKSIMYKTQLSSKLRYQRSSVHLSELMKVKKESELLIYFLVPQSWWIREVMDLSMQRHQHMAIIVLYHAKSSVCHYTMKGL